MPDAPADLRYSNDHLWTRVEDDPGLVRVGISDFAQQSLGEVTNLTLPGPGAEVRAGEACGDVESVKSLSDLIAPISGTVRTVNDVLANTPGLINADPYGHGWMFTVEVDPATLSQQLASLLDSEAYRVMTVA